MDAATCSQRRLGFSKEGKTRQKGALRWFWLAPREPEVLQINEFGLLSTAVPAKIPYPENGIHTWILSLTLPDFYMATHQTKTH